MKRVIMVGILLMCAPFVQAQDSKLENIHVSGKVEVVAKADRAIFSFTVNGTGTTLRMAVNDAKQRTSEIIDGLKQIGLKDRNFSTTNFYSNEEKSKTALIFSKTDYKTGITVTVNVDSLPLLEEAVLYLSDVKPDNFSGINFVLQDYEQIKMDALEKAIAKAKQKADLIARIMGAELGELIYFNVNPRLYNQRGSNVSPFNASYQNINAYLGSDDEYAGGSGAFYSPDRKLTVAVDAIIAVKKPM